MAKIEIAETGFYRIPLTVALSDSTHGEIKAFELVTCRVRDSDGRVGRDDCECRRRGAI